jgi:hypothetical protein
MELVTRLAGDRDSAGLHRLAKLTMTSASAIDVPPVLRKPPENVSHLHAGGVAAPSRLGQMSISAK